MVTVFHREFRGVHPLIVERVDRNGEVYKERANATVAVFCSECSKGRWMIAKQKDDTGRRPATLQDVFSGRIPYVLDWEPESKFFETRAEGIHYLRNLPDLTKTFPAIPKPTRPQTAIDVANALRERAAREKQEEPTS